MSDKEKTEITRIGLAFVSIGCNDVTAELIWRMVECIQKKKGKTSISDAAEITERKEQLIKQREDLEKTKQEAHEAIIAINAKLRKLKTVSKHAEEIFQEDQP